MNTLAVEGKTIPVVGDADVVVVGGGCAGVGAALTAAKLGAKTILVERLFCLGGTMTSGLMSKVAISPTNNGVAVDILGKMDREGTAFLKSRPEVPVDPEAAKLLLDSLLTEAGVRILYGSTIGDVVKKGRTLSHAIVENIGGSGAIRGNYFIDCTGDGQLAFKAGAEYKVGREEDNLSSSPTLMFRVANVDFGALFTFMKKNASLCRSGHVTYSHHIMSPEETERKVADRLYAHFGDFVPLIEKVLAENPKRYDEDERRILLNRGLIFMNQPGGGHVLVNASRIPSFRGDDADELTAAMIAGRKQVACLFSFMKEFMPGFENSFVFDTGAQLGVRESRRIIGDYVLTQEDVHGLARFDDVIVTNHGGIEIHSVKERGTVIKELGAGEYYHVPYRCIIARDFDNLYMAGRCFSASHAALSAARNIAYCMALGQAAGTAAARLCAAGERNVRRIDMAALKKDLASIIGI